MSDRNVALFRKRGVSGKTTVYDMPIEDKVASARKIESLLKTLITNGGLRLRYRITLDPPVADRDWEKPEIFVELSGPDSPSLLARNAELLRSIELLALESLNLRHEEHDKVIFDCMNHRSMRIEENVRSHDPDR